MKRFDIRLSILVVIAILFSIFSVRHFVLGGDIAASVDALCPFGGIESLYTYITSGMFVPRILISSLILSVGVMLTVFLFRRGFCGWICPFGTVQELLGKLSKKKITLPKNVDRYARYLKYVVLILILVFTAILGELVFRGFDPFLTFFHFGKGVLWDPEPGHLVPFIITVVVLLLAVFIERFWCRYLCPLGAFMAIFTRLGITKIHRNRRSCNNCKLCDKVCPVDIEVAKIKTLEDEECLNCNKCVDVCPKDSLVIKTGKKIKSLHYGLAVIAVFIAVIVAAQVSGMWQSVPVMPAQELDPADIKGYMTLEEVSVLTGISVHHFVSGLGLPVNIDSKTTIKQMHTEAGVGADHFREYVENYDPEGSSITAEMSVAEIAATAGICIGHFAGDLNLPAGTDITAPISQVKDAAGNPLDVEEIRGYIEGFTHDDDEPAEQVLCPWNRVKCDETRPLCGLYVDKDDDNLCDYGR